MRYEKGGTWGKDWSLVEKKSEARRRWEVGWDWGRWPVTRSHLGARSDAV